MPLHEAPHAPFQHTKCKADFRIWYDFTFQKSHSHMSMISFMVAMHFFISIFIKCARIHIKENKDLY